MGNAVDPILFLNGEFVAAADASVPIMDRGLLFADAVYEGLGVIDSQIIDFPHHMERLRRSLAELRMAEPMTTDECWHALMGLIRRNEVEEGFLYFHVTRGVAPRNYIYPTNLVPTVFAFSMASHGQASEKEPALVALATAPDLRWARRDIKTSNLLAQVIAKQHAHDVGADEALLLHGDEVTEAGSSSFFLVTNGVVVTRPLSRHILPGVTRRAVLAVVEAEGLRVEERTVTLDEVMHADEAFLTASSSYVEAVGSVDGTPIGDGSVGPIARLVRAAYLDYARQSFYFPVECKPRLE